MNIDEIHQKFAAGAGQVKIPKVDYKTLLTLERFYCIISIPDGGKNNGIKGYILTKKD